MPAIWSSSERPISVRTVWVDGVRHAILTSDDPAGTLYPKARVRSATSSSTVKTYPRINFHCRIDSYGETRTSESLDSCFVNLQVVVNERTERSNEKRIVRRQSAPTHCNRRGTIDKNSHNYLELRLDGLLNYDGDYNAENDKNSSRRLEINSINETIDLSRNNLISANDESLKKNINYCGQNCIENCQETTRKPELHSTLLSERVLQWMDLSGRSMNFQINEEKEAIMKKTFSKQKILRNEYNNISTREHVSVQSYNIETPSKSEEFDNRRMRVKRRKSKERFIDKIILSDCENLAENSKADYEDKKLFSNEEYSRENLTKNKESSFSSIGRPQLHIFMPDLNSSGDDTSSEESLEKD